jgi:hypothetical protein
MYAVVYLGFALASTAWEAWACFFGNRFYLGVIEGVADSVSSFVKLWSGGRSDHVEGAPQHRQHHRGHAEFARPHQQRCRPLSCRSSTIPSHGLYFAHSLAKDDNVSEANPPRKRERIAIAACYSGRSKRTTGISVSVFGGKWHAETCGQVRRYVHLGPREGTRTD